MFKSARLLAVLLFCVPSLVAAEIYRCESGGKVSYADEPCGDEAERINVQDNRIGGSFDQNLPEPEKEDPTASEAQARDTAENAVEPEESACQFINSTDLRRYLIREQVVKGMTKDNVLDAFGRPRETYPTPQETWVYETRYYNALYELTYVYFREGCVEEVIYRKP